MRSPTRHREIAEHVRTVLGVVGIYLILFGLVGAGWAARSAFAQKLYAGMLFGRHEAETELRMARRVFRLDSRHYAICIRAAETAFRKAETVDDPEEADAFWKEASHWTGRGLDLNPWLIELRYLEARLLARESPEAGAAAWKTYVDWHFWDVGNLEHLARFLEAAGQDAEALDTLEYLRQWPQYDPWRETVRSRMAARKP